MIALSLLFLNALGFELVLSLKHSLEIGADAQLWTQPIQLNENDVLVFKGVVPKNAKTITFELGRACGTNAKSKSVVCEQVALRCHLVYGQKTVRKQVSIAPPKKKAPPKKSTRRMSVWEKSWLWCKKAKKGKKPASKPKKKPATRTVTEKILVQETRIDKTDLKTGKWTAAQKGRNQFGRGKAFTLHILCLRNMFVIYQNGIVVGRLQGVVKFNEITTLVVRNIKLQSAVLETETTIRIKTPAEPLRLNEMLTVKGNFTGLHFSVVFLDGNNCTSFYVNPRDAEKLIVRGSHDRLDRWQTYGEQNGGKFPLVRHRAFSIGLLNTVQFIQIFINEKLFANFKHNVPYPEMNYETVYLINSDDVHISSVETTVHNKTTTIYNQGYNKTTTIISTN